MTLPALPRYGTYRYRASHINLGGATWVPLFREDRSRFLIVLCSNFTPPDITFPVNLSTYSGAGTQDLATGAFTFSGIDDHTPSSLGSINLATFRARPLGLGQNPNDFNISIPSQQPLVLKYADWGPILGYAWELLTPLVPLCLQALEGLCDAPLPV